MTQPQPPKQRTFLRCRKCQEKLGVGGRQAHCESHRCPWCSVRGGRG